MKKRLAQATLTNPRHREIIELARLKGFLTTEELARTFNSTVLLKGAGSIICEGSHWRINGSGNAALSNAGQGDALCGILAALLAQGLEPFEATCAAAWLHGTAADIWKEKHPLGIGLTASEVIELARAELNRAI